jgi:hypothetical protein
MADFLLGFICGFTLMAAVVRLALAYGFVEYCVRKPKDD